MDKDSFFDTNVIINYASYYANSPSSLNRKCFLYIENKLAKFIICYLVQEELFSVMKKRAVIHKEVLNKIEDSKYSFENSPFLSKRDVPYVKKLYESFKDSDKIKVSEYFLEERKNLEINIERFLKNKIDEKVIQLEEINIALAKIINETISNYTDCKIIASALQFRAKRNDFLLVTADGKDLDPNGYEYLKDHFKTNYSKENYKFPELLNLLFTK